MLTREDLEAGFGPGGSAREWLLDVLKRVHARCGADVCAFDAGQLAFVFADGRAVSILGESKEALTAHILRTVGYVGVPALERWRIENGYSYTKLGKLIGVREPVIRRICLGESRPTPVRAAKLLEITGLPDSIWPERRRGHSQPSLRKKNERARVPTRDYICLCGEKTRTDAELNGKPHVGCPFSALWETVETK